MSGVGRRGVLGGVAATGIAGAALAVAAKHGLDADQARADEPAGAGGDLVHPFRGAHQQGIVTPAQDAMHTVAFDVTTPSRAALVDMLTRWTAAVEQMTRGELIGGEPEANPFLPPKDTGEAWGYPAAGLTVTVGFGATLFRTAEGEDRFGIAERIPAVLAAGTPGFRGDALRPEESGGDLVVQVCADDAQVCLHAVRNLTRLAFGTARLRWSQIGYGRTSSTSTAQSTPRNLFGFKDGTANLTAEAGDAELARHLWVQPDDDAGDWLAGGTYLAARKIHMSLEIWDRVGLAEQERIIGRDKRHGAPLSVPAPTEADESVEPALDGGMIDARAHVAVVHPTRHGGARMLRRGYNYTDGHDAMGRLDAGLYFMAFVRDPAVQFHPVLAAMTSSDLLQEYLQTRSDVLVAVLPGVREGERHWGQALLA